MENIIWKDIPNYEGIYEASTSGRIRSKEGKTTYTEHHGIRKWKSRILKGRGNNKVTGSRVSLFMNGKPQDWLVARLVAMTFLGIPKTKLTVNHKNGNRLDNRIENLEWLTLGDNIRHGFETGLYPQYKIVLKEEDGTLHSFRSHSRCGVFLERSHGYVMACIKHNRQIKNKNGKKYFIEGSDIT
jgi:hypothetical protein